MGKNIAIKDVKLYLIPVKLRIPLKFGSETLTSVMCCRTAVEVESETGKTAVGWGETPLSIPWIWPSSISHSEREDAVLRFVRLLAIEWKRQRTSGHAFEIGYDFLESRLNKLRNRFNETSRLDEDLPWLAALVCLSSFDIATHDSYGKVHNLPVYETYNSEYLKQDLSAYLEPVPGSGVSFAGTYPEDYFSLKPAKRLKVWHLVGGKDLLTKTELTGEEPDDGYPVVLTDWIMRDGLECLKIKLRGNDAAWDYERLIGVGSIAEEHNVQWLSADFNCTVSDPGYVNLILDKLIESHPRIYGMLLYVEQPFPYDLEANQIDVHSVSARKPLFMDESAHDWRLIRLGRKLGWSGVALKTCKTQTGALLSLSWAKAHGMTLMVQDLTNPMLAQIPHVLLAAHADTIMGVESNAMQFYPEASLPEEKVHPGLFKRRKGQLNLDSISGSGYGYRMEEIQRDLPAAEELQW